MLRYAVLLFALITTLAPVAVAQPVGGRAFADSTTIEKRVTVLTERLVLSPEQTASVRTILYEEASQARRAVEEADGDRAAMRSAMRARLAESDRRIEALLEPDQQEAYREYREQRIREMRKRFQGSERPGL